jgi:hypothetical protein
MRKILYGATAASLVTAVAVQPGRADEPFSVRSASVNLGCGDQGEATVEFNAPSEAKITDANVRWIDVSNISSMSASANADGAKATGTGTIMGPAKVLLDCPGEGHATQELYGHYR